MSATPPSSHPAELAAADFAAASNNLRQRACLIMNPASGDPSVDNQAQFAPIWAALREAGIWAEAVETKAGESPAALARRAADTGYGLVIAAGGDGTASEVAKGLVNTETPLGILPLGTYNNMARNLGLPLELTAACQALARGRIRRIDVGLANDEHYFFEAAGVGLDVPLFPLGEEIKSARWWTLRPIWRAAQLLLRFQPVRVHFEFDRPVAWAYDRSWHSHAPERRQHRYFGNQRRDFNLRAFLVVIANGTHYGSAFTISPGAVLDDGLFHVSVFRRFSKRELIRHFFSIYQGRRHYSPKIDTFRVAEMRLTSRVPLSFHVDGRLAGRLPLQVKILHRALKVIA
jgi:diacylglycerol kinase (ATP)